LEQSDLALTIIMITGAVTAFFAASVGLFQNDIKKVIAYSTMSQLGMMVIAVGLSQYNVALAHLALHAMYKAGLFLAAGSVLHALGDQQDFRKFGGLVKLLPVTYTVMLIASLSLAALPWLSGYYSKDLIIELAYGSYSSLGYLVYLLATIAACFTMLYSVKLLYLTFLTYANAPKGNYEKTHESSWVMTFPLIVLGILSVYLGNITRDYFMGLGSQGFGNSIFTHPNHIILIDTEFGVPTLNKLLPLILSMIFAILALYLFEKKPIWLLKFNTSGIGQNIYRFFNQRYWLELIYNRCIVKGALYFGYITNTILDRGALELIGPRGAVAGLYKISNYFASFDSGSIARYAFVMFSGLLFMLLSWIIFASPESLFIDNYNSNIISITPLIKVISNYYILIYLSYLNSINIIYYYIVQNINIYFSQNNLTPGSYILCTGSDSGNNNKDSSFGGRYSPIPEGETNSDVLMRIALKRSIQDAENATKRKKSKGETEEEYEEKAIESSYIGKGKEKMEYNIEDNSNTDKGKGKDVAQPSSSYDYIDYSHLDEPGPSNIRGPLKGGQSKPTGPEWPPCRSPSRESDFPRTSLDSFNSEIDLVDQKNDDKDKRAMDYSIELNIDEKKADKNQEKFKEDVENKYKFDYNNLEKEDRKSENRKMKRDLDKENGESKELSITDRKSKYDSYLNSSSSSKSKDSNISKESVNDSLGSNNLDTIPESSTPFLTKDHPVNNFLHLLVKIIKRFFTNINKDINIDNMDFSYIYSELGNVEDMWLVSLLAHLPLDSVHILINHPLLSTLISSLLLIYRILPFIIALKQYLEDRKTMKKN